MKSLSNDEYIMTDYRSVTYRPNEPPMPDPIGYFITWTTYGTWLPGDERGWIRPGMGVQPPNFNLRIGALQLMTESACTLDRQQRAIVEETISEHCKIRNWKLHTVNCRSNHVHVVVTADVPPEDVYQQLKAWCTRRLKNREKRRRSKTRTKWWSENASRLYIGDEESLQAVIRYVMFAQDRIERDVE
ncbi:MAG: transposase [Pirellulaceae bacterium]|nr:transposase [Pirellulaceae bacterium]MDP7020093.1 transposase [Pirellulaceae bacterium]